MATLKDIARETGLDFRSVSHVLHRNDTRYSAETRRRVHEAARRLGFVANQAGRRLARTRSSRRANTVEQVGLLYVGNSNMRLDPAFLEMMRGAELELSKRDATLTFVRAGNHPTEWERVERLTRAGGIDGWLIYGPATDEILDRLRPGALPAAVIIGEHRCTRPVSLANIDSLAVGRLATQHFAALGHRRVAYMSAARRFEYQRQVLVGFRAAGKELGLDPDERLIAPTEWNGSAGPMHLFDWLLSHDPVPTAVFLPDFGMAQSLHPMMKHSPNPTLRGMSVLASGYEDPAEVGHDFTSIDLRLGEVGRAGAELLHTIVTEGLRGPQMVAVAPAVFPGHSTFPPQQPG